MSRISSGVSAATFSNAWLSVITSFGFSRNRPSTFFSSVSFTTTDTASASSISRIVCCCGRISLPLGAALSIGTTSTAMSEGSKRSLTIYLSGSSILAAEAISSFSSGIPSPVAALTQITLPVSSTEPSLPLSPRFTLFPHFPFSSFFPPPTAFSRLSCSTVFFRAASSAASFLFTAMTYGIFFSLIRSRSAISSGAAPTVPSMTSTAASVLLST